MDLLIMAYGKIELVCWIATVLLQLHHNQLFATASARPVLTVLKDILHGRVKSQYSNNMEVVHPGSKQLHPSCENFDSGVDDLNNPRHYVVWDMKKNTHIYPQHYIVWVMKKNTHNNLSGAIPLSMANMTQLTFL